MKRWVVYIITHGPIYEMNYSEDLFFSKENWKIFNVNNNNLSYIHLGKWWAESEAIYNIYKSESYKEYDYIGFIHYDFKLDHNGDYLITSLINKAINNNCNFISFYTHIFSDDYNQHIMMDEMYPNQLTGNGKNCYINIIQHYNDFYNKDITIKDIWNKPINLCSSFLTKKDIFEDLMKFLSYIIESKILDKFDTEHKFRIQAGMIERYIAIYTSQINMYDLSLKHEK